MSRLVRLQGVTQSPDQFDIYSWSAGPRKLECGAPHSGAKEWYNQEVLSNLPSSK